MRIAIATCQNLPEWEVDDAPFHQALQEKGIHFSHEIWTDDSIDWTSYDACLIRTTWDYVQQLEQFLEWSEKVSRQTMLLNPLQTIQWNTCKSYLRDLENQGIPIVPTHWLEMGSTEDLSNILITHHWDRGFIKPRVGATAFGTMRFNQDSEDLDRAQQHLDTMIETQAMMVQPYLEQVETKGEWSGIFIDGQWSHAVQKIPKQGDYRVQDDFGATDILGNENGIERELAESVISTIQQHPEWTGEQNGIAPLYGRIDILQDGSSPFINEVELVEPSLFFRHAPQAGSLLANALIRRLGF